MMRTRAVLDKILSVAFLCLTLCCAVLSQVSVLTQHNDNNRSGQNTSETLLTTSSVNVSNFGKLFALAVDGYVYAQPLYVPSLTINGSVHNVVVVATEHNSVYAFDADNASGITLWHVNLGPSVPSDDICGSSGCYTDLTPEIGITGTPVVDAQGGLLYVVAKNKDSDGTYHFRLHALNITSGADMFGGPINITTANFAPLYETNRPGLLLSGPNVYVAFGSVGDTPPWYGFVMAYDASSLQQVAVLNTSPSLTSGGSIWSGGQGPVADNAGNVYVMTANGDFNANTGGSDYSTSFLKLDASNLTVLDYFTPDNQAYLGNFDYDVDLGAGGPLLIPGSTLLLGGGKDGIFRLVDSMNMGKFNANFNADVQEWQATSALIMGGPVYWNGSKLGPVVYLWGAGDLLKAWSFNGATFQTTPVSQSTLTNPAGYSNTAPLSLSSNGNTSGTGIVWAATSLNGDANTGTVPGQLWAFDADNLSNELWDSQQNSSRDAAGSFAKFTPPTVANGKVYLPTFSSQVLVYGLLAPPGFALSAAPSSQSVTASNSASYLVYVNPQTGFSGTVTLTCSGLPSGAACSPASVAVTSGNVPVALTVTTSTSISTGSFIFTITGTSGSVVETTTVTLAVVSAPSFSLAATPLSPATITGGSSATSTVTVAPLAGFSSPVNLTCSVSPVTSVPPKCSLSSATVLNGSGTPSLTVSTVAASAAARSQIHGIYYAALLPFCGLMMLAAGRSSRREKQLVWMMSCVMFFCLIWLASCGGGSSTTSNGGGNPGTTAGNYTVTVTGTSGTLTRTSSLSVTVQ